MLTRAELIREGRELTQMFYAGDTQSLWSRFGDKMQSSMGGIADLTTLHHQIRDQLGKETQVVDERTFASVPSLYQRTATFSNFERPVFIEWALGPTGKVEGFFVRPMAK